MSDPLMRYPGSAESEAAARDDLRDAANAVLAGNSQAAYWQAVSPLRILAVLDGWERDLQRLRDAQPARSLANVRPIAAADLGEGLSLEDICGTPTDAAAHLIGRLIEALEEQFGSFDGDYRDDPTSLEVLHAEAAKWLRVAGRPLTPDLSTELRQRAAALYVEPLRRAKANYLTADLLTEAADVIDALRSPLPGGPGWPVGLSDHVDGCEQAK